MQATAVAAAVRGDDFLRAAERAAESPELQERLARARALLASPVEPAEASAALGNSSLAHESVPAALFAVASQPGFEQAVWFAVRCGGDTDTLGAMAGAVAGAAGGRTSIPARWLDALEDGERGRGHVERLASALAEAARPADGDG